MTYKPWYLPGLCAADKRCVGENGKNYHCSTKFNKIIGKKVVAKSI